MHSHGTQLVWIRDKNSAEAVIFRRLLISPECQFWLVIHLRASTVYPVLYLKGPASSVRLRMWQHWQTPLNWQHPHPDSDQLNVHLESAYCVQSKVPGPSLLGSSANKRRPGLNVGCVCVCVCMHTLANTWVYMSINIEWRVWLFIHQFFFQSKFHDCVRDGRKEHLFWQAVDSSLLLLSSGGFLRQKERKAVGWRTPGVRNPSPKPDTTPSLQRDPPGWLHCWLLQCIWPPTPPHVKTWDWTWISVLHQLCSKGPARGVASCHLLFLLPSRGT